ncbi:hypothetical protein EBT31_13250 [bacterium]|nr:hypothetical protein [bacterium]
MSNVALFNAAEVPAFARKGLSETAKALAGGAGGGGKRISIKGGVFRLLSNGKEVASIEDRHLDVVIVKAAPKVSRVFYAKTYDSDAVTGPDCWSPDGEAPSPDSANKQASRCSECPQNIAGSGQGNSRACRYQHRLAVVLADSVEGDVLQLALPATSIFGDAQGDNRPLQEYARWLAAQDISPETVVTRMKFDTKSESPKLFFKAMRWLSDDEYATVEIKGESPDAKKAITMTVAKMDNVAPAKLEGKPPVKALAKPEVQEEEEEAPAPAPKAKKAAKPAPAPAEEVDEPEVRTAPPKKPVVAEKAALASMVSEWDDE